jgi:hypothetical protein
VGKYAELASAIESEVSRLGPAVTPDLRRLLSLLSRRDAIAAEGFSSLSTDLSSGGYREAETDLRVVERKIRPVQTQFNRLLRRISPP